MCGLGGYILRNPDDRTERLSMLLAGVRERGPDDEGAVLIDSSSGDMRRLSTDRSVARVRARDPRLGVAASSHDVAFAHARYAVIDLSDAAHQPFVSRDGSIVAVLNGELYNHVELRAELAAEGHVTHTASDTEVLVEGYRVWKDGLWERLNGFWAVLLFDAGEGTVVASRDRLGVAPLYLRETADGVYFSSRIRPLLDLAPHAIDRDAVRGFIDTGIKDHDEGTFYREVRSFPAASVMTIPVRRRESGSKPLRRFWSMPNDRMLHTDLSLDDAAAGLHARLVRAVELRLRSDVRVAFELSGGLDSSSIVAAAAELGVQPRVYTISVPERDEVPFARAVARRFGLSHTVLPAGEGALVSQAGALARIMEEPYHSPNVFTSLAMRREIRARGDAVVVSGAGGDEVLGGYEHEFWDAARPALWSEGAHWHVIRHAIAHRAGSWARARHSLREVIGAGKRLVRAAITGGEDAVEEPGSTAARLQRAARETTFHDRVRFHCEVSQLPYYLSNGDHLTMSIPLEHRFPFLDWQLVEFASRLPVRYLYSGGWTKFALRHAMRAHLPDEVVWRREKSGFPFPFQRFFTAHQPTLATRADAAMQFCFGEGAPLDFASMQRADPLRLWRLCSTGYWLEASC